METIAPIPVLPCPDRLAIAMVTAPRPSPTVEQSVRELRQAGFGQSIHLFAEPGSTTPADRATIIHSNRRRLGVWRNWLSAAHRMLDATDAPFLLLCEDDIGLSLCAAPALYHAMDRLQTSDWGYASLYTPRQNLFRHQPIHGWQPVDVRWFAWGALAYAFTRESLLALFQTKELLLHAGDEDTDLVVSRAVRALGRQTYYHYPSLCRHTGAGNSTVRHVEHPGAEAAGFDPHYNGYRPAANGE